MTIALDGYVFGNLACFAKPGARRSLTSTVLRTVLWPKSLLFAGSQLLRRMRLTAQEIVLATQLA